MSRELVGGRIRRACRDRAQRGFHAGLPRQGLTPLRRIQPGDRVVYYSPNRTYSPSHAARSRDRLQAFTAIGTVKQGKPYQADMGRGFHPFRRDVAWHEAESMPLARCRISSAFTREKNWGYRLRQGRGRDQRRRHDGDRRGDVHSRGRTSSASSLKVSRLSGAHIR